MITFPWGRSHPCLVEGEKENHCCLIQINAVSHVRNTGVSPLNGNLTFCWVTERGIGAAVHTEASLTHLFCLQDKRKPLLQSGFKEKGHSYQKSVAPQSVKYLQQANSCGRSVNERYRPKPPVA